MIRFTRRKALAAAAGVSALTLGGAGTATADHEENYAEIAFSDQHGGGATVKVDRMLVGADAFITIHTWDLVANQDSLNTICGVKGPYAAGEYRNEAVRLFHGNISSAFDGQHRLSETQRLIAVPHRDMNHSGAFEFEADPHIDIPFTNGTQESGALPFPGAVNSVAEVQVG